MSFNIYTVLIGLIILLILIWRIKRGWKQGFAHELASTVSVVGAFFTVNLLYSAVVNYFSGSWAKAFATGVLLLIFGIVYGVVRLLLKILKIFSKLPIVNGIDKFFGVIAGIVEAYLLSSFLIAVLKMWL